jgi:hypothetical protein
VSVHTESAMVLDTSDEAAKLVTIPDECEERVVSLEDYVPKTHLLTRKRNDLAQTRQLIEERRKQLELEIRMAQAELRNLDLQWQDTCEEWDRVCFRGLP